MGNVGQSRRVFNFGASVLMESEYSTLSGLQSVRQPGCSQNFVILLRFFYKDVIS